MIVARAQFGPVAVHGQVIGDRFHPVDGDVFACPPCLPQSLLIDDLVLGVPVEGSRFFNVLGGFRRPGARTPEARPRWVPTTVDCPVAAGGGIRFPRVLTGPLQIEAELAVVVGRVLRRAAPPEARDGIFGWSIFNDVTAPEFGRGGCWAMAKSLDGFAAWGPWIRTDLTEERVLEGLKITSTVNGALVQSGNTRDFRHTPSEVLSDISHRIALRPGDVVSLGTPPPPVEVAVGDRVVCAVEEVGRLHNEIVDDG